VLELIGARREISMIDRARRGTHLVAIGLQGSLESARLD
jgi:hypothetical protein